MTTNERKSKGMEAKGRKWKEVQGDVRKYKEMSGIGNGRTC